MSGFDRLGSALQYQIANTLGWSNLRPVQTQTIDAVLDGKNCVVLAPTAGGKTEAAFFPLLSAMDASDWRPVSVIYLSPIRALLNNQVDRIARLGGMVGRRAFKWHGDVGQSERRRFLREPTDILLTTPESLEAMLMSKRVPSRDLFGGLQAVVIDEVHAFAADDRGAHLSAILERLVRFCGRDVQRIGLSATVGNPDEILRWVQGSSHRNGFVVDPGGAKKRADLSIDYVGGLENAAQVIRALHPGRKRLVFVDSRRKAEELGKLLARIDVVTFVTHGSLSASQRADAERAFQEGSDCVIVATSALELGIDVGDLDHVLQIDSPPTVASFLQRMGRTGRRDGASPNCTFLCTSENAVLQAAAIVDLYRRSWVEPVEPSRRAAHILAHQILALAIDRGGIVRGDIWGWLEGATAFADLTREDRESIVDHMLNRSILADHDGKLWLGEEGERLYGRANFEALYAVFDVPRLIKVTADAREVGTVDADFLRVLTGGEPPAAFTLAGQPWEVVHVDWPRGVCVVRPAKDARAARWSGGPRFLSYALCQAMRRVLVGDDVDPAWSKRAQSTMTTLREEHRFVRNEETPFVESVREITWWNFAGGAANALLAKMFERELGRKVVTRNTSITCRENAARSSAAIRELMVSWMRAERPSREDVFEFAAGDETRVSKFEPCLPTPLLRELQAARTVDHPNARRALATTAVLPVAPHSPVIGRTKP